MHRRIFGYSFYNMRQEVVTFHREVSNLMQGENWPHQLVSKERADEDEGEFWSRKPSYEALALTSEWFYYKPKDEDNMKKEIKARELIQLS
ncbi:hypothetical protein ACJX0J_033643, partial [Zea mays]